MDSQCRARRSQFDARGVLKYIAAGDEQPHVAVRIGEAK